MDVLTYLSVLFGLSVVMWVLIRLADLFERRLKEPSVLSGIPHYRTDLTVLLQVADKAFSGEPEDAQACLRVAHDHGIPIAGFENLLEAAGLGPDTYTRLP